MSCACHPSPYNTNNKCQQYSCFAELSALTNPAFPSLWGVEENYPLVDIAAQQHGEDFVVPDASDVFPFSDNTHLGGFQLPTFREGNNYLSGCGLDGQGLSSEYFMNVSENGHKADVSALQEYYGTNYASTYDHLTTLGKSTLEIQSKRNEATAGSAGNMRVGRYSVEERRDRILRYLKKRNQRNFNKTIKYACRKTLADRRIRVRGRFAKNNEEVSEMNHNGGVPLIDETISPPCSYYDYYTDDQFHQQTKQDGEEWLQEAITNLMYNYIPQWQAGHPLQ